MHHYQHHPPQPEPLPGIETFTSNGAPIAQLQPEPQQQQMGFNEPLLEGLQPVRVASEEMVRLRNDGGAIAVIEAPALEYGREQKPQIDD